MCYSICCSQFIFSLAFTFQAEHPVDISALTVLIGPTIWTFIFIFAYCELGQRVSEAFDKPYDAISQLKWNLFPLDVQRVLPIIMVGAQQPIDLRGYMNISCTRERFKRVSEKKDFMTNR